MFGVGGPDHVFAVGEGEGFAGDFGYVDEVSFC